MPKFNILKVKRLDTEAHMVVKQWYRTDSENTALDNKVEIIQLTKIITDAFKGFQGGGRNESLSSCTKVIWQVEGLKGAENIIGIAKVWRRFKRFEC